MTTIPSSISDIPGGVCAPNGFRAGGIRCGIRANKDKKDLALIVSDTRATAACVYTRNRVQAAPITVTRNHIADGYARAILCNSGNANACNADGIAKATRMAASAASALGIDATDVIVASTGVIGQPLPIEPIERGMVELASALKADASGSDDATAAIMTTDLRPKQRAVAFTIGGVECKLGGICKGSGMIHPNMATMLAFLTTDAAVSSAMLQKALATVVDESFNMISVDGDTSTNDMLTILANGTAGNPPIATDGADFDTFVGAVRSLCIYLAREMARDGEGATKLIECTVSAAPDVGTARAVAKSIITSSLFKTMMFGEDANWGRILCAIGYTDAPTDFTIHTIDVTLRSAAGTLPVYKAGAGVAFSEDAAKTILSEDTIMIDVSLGCGDASATAWGCDLSYEYVKINGDYRT